MVGFYEGPGRARRRSVEQRGSTSVNVHRVPCNTKKCLPVNIMIRVVRLQFGYSFSARDPLAGTGSESCVSPVCD